MVSKATGPRLYDKIHGSLAYFRLSSASQYQVPHKILHSKLSLVLENNSGNKDKWFGGRCTSQDRATGGRSRSCYLLAERTLGSQVALLSLHSQSYKMGSIPQRLCVDKTQYSPKSVSFHEDTWGEDSYISDLLRGVLSGDIKLLTEKEKELSKSWNFLQIFSLHLIPWGVPGQNYTSSNFLNWGKDTRLS